MERALIAEYRQTVGALLPKLTTAKLAQAVAIASIPEDIRGYGHVKERHLTAAKEKEASLIIAFNAPPALPSTVVPVPAVATPVV